MLVRYSHGLRCLLAVRRQVGGICSAHVCDVASMCGISDVPPPPVQPGAYEPGRRNGSLPNTRMEPLPELPSVDDLVQSTREVSATATRLACVCSAEPLDPQCPKLSYDAGSTGALFHLNC